MKGKNFFSFKKGISFYENYSCFIIFQIFESSQFVDGISVWESTADGAETETGK